MSVYMYIYHNGGYLWKTWKLLIHPHKGLFSFGICSGTFSHENLIFNLESRGVDPLARYSVNLLCVDLGLGEWQKGCIDISWGAKRWGLVVLIAHHFEKILKKWLHFENVCILIGCLLMYNWCFYVLVVAWYNEVHLLNHL